MGRSRSAGCRRSWAGDSHERSHHKVSVLVVGVVLDEHLMDALSLAVAHLSLRAALITPPLCFATHPNHMVADRCVCGVEASLVGRFHPFVDLLRVVHGR